MEFQNYQNAVTDVAVPETTSFANLAKSLVGCVSWVNGTNGADDDSWS
jgi:hypothetical protein